MSRFHTAYGHRILQISIHPSQDEAIVLVRLHENTVTPYATYVMNGVGITASGDYHTNYDDCLTAYKKRSYPEAHTIAEINEMFRIDRLAAIAAHKKQR